MSHEEPWATAMLYFFYLILSPTVSVITCSIACNLVAQIVITVPLQGMHSMLLFWSNGLQCLCIASVKLLFVMFCKTKSELSIDSSNFKELSC